MRLARASSTILMSVAFMASRVSGAFVGNANGIRSFSRSTTLMMASDTKYPIPCGEDVMSQKAHGTSDAPVQDNLRWNCDKATADKICNFNRHYAEHAGYWQNTSFLDEVRKNPPTEENPTKYHDAVTGKLLFTAPVGRSMKDYLAESASHGWPSFRDEEVNWDYVRCLSNGECVSVTGTHLGHNLPDKGGNRYCINLVSVAGRPEDGSEE